MSNQFIKELYHGSRIPAERQIVKDSEMAAAMEEMVKAEDLLKQIISPEVQPILKRLTDAQITVTDLTAESYFIDGFKIGARLMMDIQDDCNENLEPVKAAQEDSPTFWCDKQKNMITAEKNVIICLARLYEGIIFRCPYKSADERLQYDHPCPDYKEVSS